MVYLSLTVGIRPRADYNKTMTTNSVGQFKLIKNVPFIFLSVEAVCPNVSTQLPIIKRSIW